MQWKLVGCVLLLACLLLEAAPVMAEGESTVAIVTVPLITREVAVSNINHTSATINWKTNDDATSQVFYDTSWHDSISDYTYHTAIDTSLVSNHSLALTGLSSSTTYHYRVRSVIPGTASIAISDDYTFTTLSPTAAEESIGDTTTSVTTSVFGSTTAMTLNSSGVVQNTVTFTSPDGKESLTVPAGTIAKDANGNPLSSLTAAVNPNPPAPPQGKNILLALDLGPSGATFSPPLTLTVSYDPAALAAQGISEDSLVTVFYNAQTGNWEQIQGTIDKVNHRFVASVSHFSTFALIGSVTPTPPTPTTPAPTTPEPTNWLLIGGIIAAVAVIGVIIWVLVAQRRNVRKT